MKISLLFSFSVLIVAYFYFSKSDLNIPEDDKLAWKISLQTAEEFKDKYNLRFIALGLNGDELVLKKIKLSFSLDYILNKNEGRQLILNLVRKFIDNINNFENIRPYLVVFPFTEDNIELTILFYKDEKYSPSIDPEICVISFQEGKIYYRTQGPIPPHLYKSLEIETLEEAGKLVLRKN